MFDRFDDDREPEEVGTEEEQRARKEFFDRLIEGVKERAEKPAQDIER